MGDLGLLCLLELLIVIFFAVHLEHDVDVFSCDKEALTVVLSNSLLNFIVDNNFLVVCLVILSVSWRFHRESLWEEQSEVQLGGILLEGQLDQLIISLVKELKGIFISQLNKSELSEYLWVDDS